MSNPLNDFLNAAQSKVENLGAQRDAAQKSREQFESAEFSYTSALEAYDSAYTEALDYGLPRDVLKDMGFEPLDRAERRRVKDLEKAIQSQESDATVDNEEN